MFLLGILCIIAGGGMLAGVVYSETATMQVVVFSQSLGSFPQWVFFLFGMGAGAVALFGIQLLVGSVTRRTRRRVKRHQERRATRQHTESLQAERDRLAEQLDQERAGNQPPPPPPSDVYPTSEPAAEPRAAGRDRGARPSRFRR